MDQRDKEKLLMHSQLENLTFWDIFTSCLDLSNTLQHLTEQRKLYLT